MKSSRTTALSVELLYSCTETSRVDGQRAREEGQVSRVCMSTSMSVSDYKRGSIDSLLLTSTFTTVRVLLSRSSSLCGCFTAVCFSSVCSNSFVSCQLSPVLAAPIDVCSFVAGTLPFQAAPTLRLKAQQRRDATNQPLFHG